MGGTETVVDGSGQFTEIFAEGGTLDVGAITSRADEEKSRKTLFPVVGTSGEESGINSWNSI